MRSAYDLHIIEIESTFALQLGGDGGLGSTSADLTKHFKSGVMGITHPDLCRCALRGVLRKRDPAFIVLGEPVAQIVAGALVLRDALPPAISDPCRPHYHTIGCEDALTVS